MHCYRLLPLLAVTFSASAADPATDFYNAIRSDDFATVDRLVKTHGAGFRDKRGATPLMYAAASGSEAMMRRLLDAGADVKAKNAFDASALHWCGGSYSRMKLLVEHGADVNLRSKQGHTPLFLAASQADGLASVRLLLEKGASLAGPPAPGGMTPLAAAALANDTAAAKFILEKGGAAVLPPPGGPLALFNAARNGNPEIVRLLISMGVDVNFATPPVLMEVKNGPIAIGLLTPLLVSVAPGNTEVVRALLQAGANVNAQDVRGMTPLMLAVATDHPNHDVVKLLLRTRPDTSIKSKAGETALDWALKFQDPEIVAAVRAASPGIQPVRRTPPSVEKLNAADPLAALRKSIPLLQTAAATGFTEGGCISCHAGNIVSSVTAAARRKGVAIDEARAAENLRASRLLLTIPADGLLERTDLPAVEIMTYALAALIDEGVQPDRTTDALLHNLASQQLASGYWAYTGIMRPPTNDHLITVAAFAIRAFRHFAPPARKQEYEERAARARVALEAVIPSTTEDLIMQMLGLHWAGAAPSRVQRIRDSILALQRADGGWGQTPRLASDAYATGTALYALSECGLSSQAAQYKRGVKFLLNTQAADGSWYVASRSPKFQPYFEGGFPYNHDQWISQWATGWAALALARTLPEIPSSTARR